MTAPADREATVRAYFESFRTGDRAAIERLLAPEFTFTSPHDACIDRATYFERCWSQAGTFTRHELGLILSAGDDAVVHYDGVGEGGARIRNVERLRFIGDQIAAIEVFFGQPQGVPGVAPREAIAAVLEQRKEALQLKDARLVAAEHASDSRTFGLAPPLATRGVTEAELAAWFRTWEGLLQWETREPVIDVSGDLAVVTALERLRGKKAGDGREVDLWFRTTLELRKRAGAWKICHEHQSVPFYMDGSGRAALDLRPGTRGSDAPQEPLGAWHA